MFNYSLLPENMQDGFRLYIEQGIEGGGFMMACLENDLKGAFARADPINRARLFDIVQFIYMEMPSQSQGSPERVQAWIERGGLAGNEAAA